MKDQLLGEFQIKRHKLAEIAIRNYTPNNKRIQVPFVNSIGKAVAIWCRVKEDFISLVCMPFEDTDELFIRIKL